MKRALVALAACGHPASHPASPPVSNRAAAAHDRCTDTTTTDTRVFAFTVSDDPDDPRPVDESFDRTWERARPRFATCGASGARAFVSLRVARTGAVTEVKIRGADPHFDRCVCEVVLTAEFPPQGRPVFATLVVRVP